MKPITGEVLIGARVEGVFDFAADERNEPLYNRRMLRVEKVTDGELGVGTRFNAVMKTAGGMPVVIEYTGFSRPGSLTSLSRTDALDIEGAVTFTPEGDRTRLSWTWKLHPKGYLRLLAPLIWLIGSRQERANWISLKNYLETRQA